MTTCILSKPGRLFILFFIFCTASVSWRGCPWVPNKTWVVWGLQRAKHWFLSNELLWFDLGDVLCELEREPFAAVRFACLQESDKCKQKLRNAANIFRGQTQTPQTDEWQTAALCWVLVRFFMLIVHPVFVFRFFFPCVCVHNASVVTLHNTASGNNVRQRVCSMGK